MSAWIWLRRDLDGKWMSRHLDMKGMNRDLDGKWMGGIWGTWIGCECSGIWM